MAANDTRQSNAMDLAGNAVQYAVNGIVLAATFSVVAVVNMPDRDDKNTEAAAIVEAISDFKKDREIAAKKQKLVERRSGTILRYSGRPSGIGYLIGYRQGMTFADEQTGKIYKIPCNTFIGGGTDKITALFVAATTEPAVSEEVLLEKVAGQQAEVINGFREQCGSGVWFESKPDDIMSILSVPETRGLDL